MQKTNIGYLTHTCNPIAMRCTPISPGCANCWHLALCDMHKKNPKFSDSVRAAKAGIRWPMLIKKERDSMLVQGKHKRIGVQFMGDLFHEKINIRGNDLERIFFAMSCGTHDFLILTKRPERMAKSISFFYGDKFAEGMDNVWLGTSCENQKYADERILHLLEILAAVRWVSFEPMLEEIDLRGVLGFSYDNQETGETIPVPAVNWVVVGCESGPGRRPCKLDWAYSLVDQCKAAGVPVWVKQIEIDGKVETDMAKFPKELQVRELPAEALP